MLAAKLVNIVGHLAAKEPDIFLDSLWRPKQSYLGNDNWIYICQVT